VRAAMKTIGIGGKEQEAVFTMIAAILHLGNVKFAEDAREAVTFRDEEQVSYSARTKSSVKKESARIICWSQNRISDLPDFFGVFL
jgi:myosin heavy subunit